MQSFQWLFILLGMIGSAFFSGMETGVISIHRMRLKHYVRQGSESARILQSLLDDPDRFIGAILVGNNLCLVLMSTLATGYFVSIFRHWGEAVSTGVMSALVLLFGEYIPKAWFHARPYYRCRRFARTFRTVERILRPAASLVLGLSRLLTPGRNIDLARRAPFVTRDDLKTLVHEGEQNGVLSQDERIMIHRVFELSHKRARDIMVPLPAVVTAPANMPIAAFLERARNSGYTRMPVVDPQSGEYVGIVNVFQVLAQDGRAAARDATVGSFARPPLRIPETMPVDDIFPRLRRGRQPLCLAVNADKKVTGLITTEDILEEIVGKL
jgi:putative hemolysin